MRRGTRVLTIGLGAMALFISGCFIAQQLGLLVGSGPKFNHKTHVKDQDLACETCHKDALTADKAGMPSKQKCGQCHEGEEKKPPEKRAESLFKDGKLITANVTALSEDVIFSHKVHTSAKIACVDCHKGIETSEAITADVRVGMKDCMACHAQKNIAALVSDKAQASDGCALCHKTIRKDAPPPSHAKLWKQSHGAVVRMGEKDVTANNCSLCHNESSCTACHQDEEPASHNSYWRHRGHGVSASIDRDACATCHRTDYCQRCHEETAPRSHTGSWGAPTDNHCLTCHFPLKSEGCLVCHKGTSSHQSATPKPSWHVSSMNCRQCHGNGVELPHVDKGDNCNGCHN